MPGSIHSSIRLFTAARLQAGVGVAGSASQAHHLGTVMRRRAGGMVRLFNGHDGEWQARIEVLHRDRLALMPERRLRPQAAEPDLWLAFALLKRDATDLVVQKATELGVSAIHPVVTAHTGAARVNLDRLRAIAVEAAEQSERLTVPDLHEACGLPALLAGWPCARRLAVAVERREAPPITAAAGGLLVGPEGGFDPAELDVLHRHPFVVPVTLGPRVLRAETAAIVGLALLQAVPGHR